MAGLTGKTISSSFKSLLRVDDDTNGVNSTLEKVTDGEGTESCLKLSTSKVTIQSTSGNSNDAFTVYNNGGNNLLRVDSTNSIVKVNSGQEIANTQYATFKIDNTYSTNFAAGYHYPLFFGSTPGVADGSPTNLDNGADPETSLTTATDAHMWSQFFWYVTDDITIDSITSIEGADAASGDTTRFHLMGYTFNSGSTTCLASGVIIASNTQTVNAGYEQLYKSVWSVDSSYEDVDAGKVILATFEQDGTNSDYSAIVTVKYHTR